MRAGFESAPEAVRFGELGGVQYGACKRPGHAAKGCTGLCDVRTLMGEEMYQEWGGEAMEAECEEEMHSEMLALVSPPCSLSSSFSPSLARARSLSLSRSLSLPPSLRPSVSVPLILSLSSSSSWGVSLLLLLLLLLRLVLCWWRQRLGCW